MFQPGDLLIEPRGSLKNSVRIINPTRHTLWTTQKKGLQLGSVVRRQISVNPGLNVNPSFFISPSKSLFRMIFSLLYYFFLYCIQSLNYRQKKFDWVSYKPFRYEIKFHTYSGLSKPSFEQPSLRNNKRCAKNDQLNILLLIPGRVTTFIWTIHLHNMVQTNDGTSNLLSFH